MQELHDHLRRHARNALLSQTRWGQGHPRDSGVVGRGGHRISSLSRAKGFKEDTILRWLREAARHAEVVEEALMADYEVSKAQVDGLWTYVGHKGQKGGVSRARAPESSGA